MAGITTAGATLGRNQLVEDSLVALLGKDEAQKALESSRGAALDSVKTKEAAWF